MDPDRLFLAIIEDLKRLLADGDAYSMLRASALLRQLLMDGRPLVHAVNRRRRIPFRFTVAGRRLAETMLAMRPVFFCALDGIHASAMPGLPSEQMKLEQFLGTKVLALGAEVLTIGDLISISANVLGGVHSGEAEADKERALAHFSQHVAPPGQSLNAAQMKPVIRLVLEALEPIARAVRRDVAGDKTPD